MGVCAGTKMSKVYKRALLYAKRVDSILRAFKEQRKEGTVISKHKNSYSFSVHHDYTCSIQITNKISFNTEQLLYHSPTGNTVIRYGNNNRTRFFDLTKEVDDQFKPENYSTEMSFQLSLLYTDQELFKLYVESFLKSAGWTGKLSYSDAMTSRFTNARNKLLEAFYVPNREKYRNLSPLDKFDL